MRKHVLIGFISQHQLIKIPACLITLLISYWSEEWLLARLNDRLLTFQL